MQVMQSFPTRRSSDLIKDVARKTMEEAGVPIVAGSDGVLENEEDAVKVAADIGYPVIIKADRKSTRLNSSHVAISYAVFCLRKQNVMVTEDNRTERP